MGRKSKYTIEEKVQAVLDYKSGKRGKAQICNDLGLNKSGTDLYRWLKHYDKYGESAFLPKKSNKAYTKEFKEIVVQEYLNGEGVCIVEWADLVMEEIPEDALFIFIDYGKTEGERIYKCTF